VPSSTPIAPAGPGQDQVLPPEPELHPPGGGDPPARAVLVGVDGGECALTAVRWAAEEALRRRAPLRILHAATYLGRQVTPDSRPPELPRARRITGQAYTVAVHTAAAVRAETEVVPGDPAKVLLAEAPEAQLVVLGIATTGAADELVVAPVAQRVVSHSATPVVVVPRGRPPVGDDRPVVAVLGFGDAEDDEPVVAFAADAARRSGVPLEVVRPQGRVGAGAEVDWAERMSDLDVSVQDVPGSPAELLRAVCPSPLVVLSAGHGGFLHRTLDGPHRYLLRHCTSPMALVPSVHRRESEPSEGSATVG
jgi:nucleotide-binding universal stress UspA family protein